MNLLLPLLLGALLPLLDTTMLNLAVPTIAVAFGRTPELCAAVLWLYTFAAATAVPLSPYLSLRFGASRVWFWALVVFFLATVGAALAPSFFALLGARLCQGLATGLLLPVVQTLVVERVGKAQAKAAMATLAVPSVLVPLFAPLLGAGLLGLGSWRFVFALQLPLALVACFWARRLPPSKPQSVGAFDGLGALAVATWLWGTLYGLQHGLVLLLAQGLLLLLLLRPHPQPILAFALFQNRHFAACAWVSFWAGAAYYGALFWLPLWLKARAYGLVVVAGLLAVHGLGMLWARRRLKTQASPQWLWRLSALGVLGSLPLLWISSPWVLMLGLWVRGAAVGALTIAALASAYAELAPEEIAHASALSRVITFFAGAGSVALLGAWMPAGGALLLLFLALALPAATKI